MSKKLLLAFLLILTFVLTLSFTPVLAKNSNKDPEPEIPEKEGVYDVPGHPNLKVRVFVHQPRPLPKPKPSPSPSPSPVCNLDDPGSNAVVDPTGWYLPNTWTYNLNSNSVPGSVGSVNLAVMANDAFGRWSAASGNQVSFSQGSDTLATRQAYDGKNIITWGRTSGTALAVTYIWYYTSTRQVAEVDTIMNKKYSWTWVPYSADACVNPSTYDSQDILTHELGHWLGLDDEYTSDYVDNTMYGYGAKGEIKKDTLTSGDIAATASIYE